MIQSWLFLFSVYSKYIYIGEPSIVISFVSILQEYMITKLGIDETKVPEMCVQLYKDYGTTMAGLRVWFPCNTSLDVPKYVCSYHCHIISDCYIYVFQAIGYDFDYDDYHGYNFIPLYKA